MLEAPPRTADLKQVKGQEVAKRALEIAAAGGREALRSLRRRVYALDEDRGADGFVSKSAVSAQLPREVRPLVTFDDAGDLCRVALIHGTADQSAPPVAAELLEARLRLLGADVEATRLYRGWTHTDPILERPFAGDQRLHRDIFDLVDRWTGGGLPAFDGALPGLRRMCPQALIDFGHAAMPF